MTWAPNTVTVNNMVTGARNRADMLNTQFCTDAEIITYLDIGHRKLYNQVINRFQNYYVSQYNINLVVSQQEYDLPSDFLKLIGCDMYRAGLSYTMRPWSFNERNRVTFSYNGTPLRYILKAGKIRFLPIPTTTDYITMYYVPAPTTLVAGGTVEVFNGFDEYIMLDAAIKMKQKEESDVQILLMQQAEVAQLLLESLEGRDAGLPERMTDVEKMNDNLLFPFWGL